MDIEEYVDHMRKTVFPHSIELLSLCKTFDDIAAWRNQHLFSVKAANLQGEAKPSGKSAAAEGGEEKKF